VAFDFALSGHKEVDGMIEGHAHLARTLGGELGLSDHVLDAVGASYERWDGQGWPGELSGDAIPVEARISQLAEFAEVAYRSGGIAAAQSVATRRSRTQFDPDLVDVLCADSEKVFHGIDELDSWDAVIDGEPALAVRLSPAECDAALAAIARFVDLKSPFTLGHSIATAELADRAARQLGMPAHDAQTVYRAGLVCGFGRLGVSNAVWDKRGPLTLGDWERVRLQPHFTERMLRQSEAIAPIGRIAGQYRERLDGSGYPRGLTGAAITRSARVLAAADAYQAMREPRPHRPARTPEDAASELRAEVEHGRLERDAVEAVLDAAGHRVPRRRQGPSGLTARELDVLRLVAQGLSSKEIAARLVIAPKTVGNHIEHIYTKIGVTNRAAASLYAMQHGLLPEHGFPP
jgi:HD-GYP domain-containing protein (c-di-GMP phosphodiesterase class II)